MKKTAAILFTSLTISCYAQQNVPALPDIKPMTPPAAPANAPSSAMTPPRALPAPTAAKTGSLTIDMGGTKSPAMQKGDGVQGFKLKDFPVNDLFQYLARQAGKQYFANQNLKETITGQMKEGDPIQRMQEVAFQYGITLYQKGDTIYAIPSDSVASLPKKQGEFRLKYLRPDAARIKELLSPFLTAEGGSVDYEDKTNTVVVHDNDPAIARVADFLERVDVPQRQVTIQVRVFRVNTDAANRVGVDWSNTLGTNGLNLQATTTTALQQIFGVNIAKSLITTVFNSTTAKDIAAGTIGTSSTRTDSSSPTQTGSAQTDVTIGPTAVTAILRALYESVNVEEESAPTVVTEDNETAVIENIDKIPIVTSTVQPGSTGQQSIVTSEVRYRIDPDDKFDVGVKVTVKPTILPGNKIRLVVEPSVGSIKKWVSAASGDPAIPNEYPDVLLSRMKDIATIPNGYTLLFGGFSRITTTRGGTKVPILGDIPGVNFFFKSRENTKIRENLVFMITATATDVTKPEVIVAETERIRRTYLDTTDAHSAENERVNLTPEPNLLGTIQDELTPFPKKAENQNIISSKNPKNVDLPKIKTPPDVAHEKAAAMGLPPEPRTKKRPWEHIIPSKTNGATQPAQE